MAKRIAIVIIILVIVVGGLAFYKYRQIQGFAQKMMSQRPPPATVSTVIVKPRSWQSTIDAVGSLEAINGVDISPEVSGIISQINISSGQMVKRGDILVKLDDSIEQANLKRDEAQLNLSQVNYKRIASLFKRREIAETDRDQALAELKQARAAVVRDKATIAQKAIRAPFTGKAGIIPVQVGQFISAGATLVTLQALDRLHVNFYVPGDQISLVHVGQPMQVQVDAYPSKTFDGTINAVNAKVDADTRNLQIQATINNSENHLLPGMFANVAVQLPVEENVVAIPETAISYSLYGDTVYLVESSGQDEKGNPALTVKRVSVKLGPQKGNEVIVLRGVKAGDQVVTAGQLKLTDGARVTINNTVKLS
jgi:membrane fusion protein (multidrug efflux system)